MAGTSRQPLVLGSDGLSQNLQSGDAFQIPAYTVANLPSGAAVKVGALAYATNGRAITDGAVGTFSMQASGSGTGCLVSYSGTVWQVAGTAVTVSA